VRDPSVEQGADSSIPVLNPKSYRTPVGLFSSVVYEVLNRPNHPRPLQRLPLLGHLDQRRAPRRHGLPQRGEGGAGAAGVGGGRGGVEAAEAGGPVAVALR
jgi:hypothetical protein